MARFVKGQSGVSIPDGDSFRREAWLIESQDDHDYVSIPDGDSFRREERLPKSRPVVIYVSIPDGDSFRREDDPPPPNCLSFPGFNPRWG